MTAALDLTENVVQVWRVDSLATTFVNLRTYANVPLNTQEAPRLAFIQAGKPTVNDWQLCDWSDATRTEVEGSLYSRPFRLLIGPNSENGGMAATTYRVFIQIFDTPEVVVQLIGSLVIT
jgi:hypothetical protein